MMGMDWIDRSLSYGIDLKSVFFLSENLGFVAGDNGIYKSIDGGETWNIVYENYDDYIVDIYFPHHSRGYAVGYNGLFLKSVDGGESWFKKDVGTEEHLWVVHFDDMLRGWV
jgi:hypothetical protein